MLPKWKLEQLLHLVLHGGSFTVGAAQRRGGACGRGVAKIELAITRQVFAIMLKNCFQSVNLQAAVARGSVFSGGSFFSACHGGCRASKMAVTCHVHPVGSAFGAQ